MEKISIISGTNNRLLVVAPHREETGTGNEHVKFRGGWVVLLSSMNGLKELTTT